MGRWFGYIIAMIGTLSLMYSNCGRVGPGGLVTSGASKTVALSAGQLACELDRKTVYGRTFFPFLKDTCSSCHQHTSGHASLNIDVSFNAFQQIGTDRIIYQATHPHGGNQFGAANQATINSFLPDWSKAGEDYVKCMSAAGATIETAPVNVDLNLGAKTIPDIEKTRTNASIWIPVDFDLGSGYSGTLTVEAQYWLNVRSEVIGLLVRNPRLKLAAAQDPIFFKGINIYIDGTLRTSATTFSALNVTKSAGTETLLLQAVEPMGIPGISANVKLGLELKSFVKNPGAAPTTVGATPTSISGVGTGTSTGGATVTPTPTPTSTSSTVTFSDLVNGPATLRVFGNNCTACHKAGLPSGGLDLTNYASASARASTILARMNSSSSPMPASGKISQSQIDLVQAWVNAGKPQ